MRTLLAIIFICILSTNTAIAQEKEPKVGLMASLQSMQSDITVPIRISDRAMFGPSFSFLYVEDGGKDVGIGLLYKSYLKAERDPVSTFFTIRAGVLHLSPEIGQSTTDVLGGFGTGADYFISEWATIGVEAQLNATKSDKNSNRFGNRGGLNVNTGMAVQLTIFFNP